jgi:hypothetical protein
MSKHCAQIVPKVYQEYQNVSKDIELHRNQTDQKNGRFSEDIYYFLHFSFFGRFLHTVEVTGSNPLSPTDLYQRRLPDKAPPIS